MLPDLDAYERVLFTLRLDHNVRFCVGYPKRIGTPAYNTEPNPIAFGLPESSSEERCSHDGYDDDRRAQAKQMGEGHGHQVSVGLPDDREQDTHAARG